MDFEGTSPQVDASVNCPVGMVYAACYCAFRGIARAEIPNCEGYMVPIHVHAPAGTVVNPVLPAACGARGVIGYRVYDAVMGALAPALDGEHHQVADPVLVDRLERIAVQHAGLEVVREEAPGVVP